MDTSYNYLEFKVTLKHWRNCLKLIFWGKKSNKVLSTTLNKEEKSIYTKIGNIFLLHQYSIKGSGNYQISR